MQAKPSNQVDLPTYERMLRVGVCDPAVRQKMSMDRVQQCDMDAMFNSLQAIANAVELAEAKLKHDSIANVRK